MAWLTARPQSRSNLMGFNKRKEERLNPWLHTCLVQSQEQTQPRDFQVLVQIQTQRTSVTQVCPHAAAVLVYRANTVAVTCSYRPAAAGRPNSTRAGSSTGHVYELGGVDGCQHLPSLSSSLSSLVSVSCTLLNLWFVSMVMKSYCNDSDQSFCPIQWGETVM